MYKVDPPELRKVHDGPQRVQFYKRARWPGDVIFTPEPRLAQGLTRQEFKQNQ